jgi:YidC/Oxa1 family membrane protein insertase
MSVISHFFTIVLYQPLFNLLFFLAWLVPGHSIGWAIILVTLLVRVLLLPSSIKMLHEQARMRALQPKLEALKNEHGSNKEAHSKAVMELYAAEKVSPLGGCLPMLVQLPILLVLYRVFIHGLAGTDTASLLYSFTPHLASINTHWLGLDISKPEKFIIPILAAGLQYLQTNQMMKLQPTPVSTGKKDEGDVAQMMNKQMMVIAPLMTYFITFRLPAALGLYWVATNLFMVLQQTWFLRRPLPELKLSNTIKTKDNVTVTIRSKGQDKDGDND